MVDAEQQEQRAKKRVQTDMLGVDFSSSGIKAVRIKKTKTGLVATQAGFIEEDEDELIYPKGLNAHHASISISSPESIIRLITLPGGSASKLNAGQLREQIGVQDDYRLSYINLPTENRGENRILAVAISNELIKSTLWKFNQPQPAPVSMESSALSALTAFMSSPQMSDDGGAYGFIESGENVNLVAFFSKAQLVLLRKFDFGGAALIDKVQRHLGLDKEVATGLVTEGSFDLSEPVRDVVGPFFRQLSISKDFVERHQRTRLTRLYVSGGMSLSKYWLRELSQELGVEVVPWNPFQALSFSSTPGGEVYEQGARYTSAIGAALGVMEDL